MGGCVLKEGSLFLGVQTCLRPFHVSPNNITHHSTHSSAQMERCWTERRWSRIEPASARAGPRPSALRFAAPQPRRCPPHSLSDHRSPLFQHPCFVSEPLWATPARLRAYPSLASQHTHPSTPPRHVRTCEPALPLLRLDIPPHHVPCLPCTSRYRLAAWKPPLSISGPMPWASSSCLYAPWSQTHPLPE